MSEAIVQQLLDENRKLKVDVARFRMEADEAKLRLGKPDARLGRLEAEISRLREELYATRMERDVYRQAVADLVARLQHELK